MKLFFDDPQFDGQFARTLGKAAVGLADVGELSRYDQVVHDWLEGVLGR